MNRILLCAMLLLAGCSLAPPAKHVPVQLTEAFKEEGGEKLPDGVTWKKAIDMEKFDRGEWWKMFGDARLDELEKQAADANPNLKIAAARLTEARAMVTANAVNILPDLNVGANAARTRPSGNGTFPLKTYSLYDVGATASYDVDLFGRLRDIEKAYAAEAAAQEALYRSTLLALQADVAQNYFLLQALDGERAAVRDAVKMREEAERIMGRRFAEGDVSAQDHARTETELAQGRADLLALDRARAATEHLLASIMGKVPAEFALEEMPLAGAPPAVPAGLPSALLQRRPDIAAATARMAAANARIGAARAAFFPSLSLTASGGYQSNVLGDLFDWSSRTWTLGQLAGMALTMPVFNNGRLRAGLDVAEAGYVQAIESYRQQALNAFRDVEDNLSDQRILAEQSAQQDKAADAAMRTTDLVQKRYDEGDVSYFEVIDADRVSLASQRAAIQARGQRFITAVALVRALGGGWGTGDAKNN